MDDTPNLTLPYIMAAQAQKHVTHNEAIRALDAIVQLGALDKDLTAPPASPADGHRYIVAAEPTGAWAGQAGKIAAYQDGAWAFYTPREGWLAWVADEDNIYAWDGAAWVVAGGGTGSVNPTPLVGVNATADTSNRLAVASPATLLSHDGSDHRLKINKAAAANTAAVLFQDAFSGRAEFGIAGDDDFRVKVSADGSTWKEAIVVDRSTGRVALPQTTEGAINVLSDSGRFAAATTSLVVGAFTSPAYLVPYTSTLAAHGKFIFDNTNFGGAAGTMTADVQALIEKIRTPASSNVYRRYGVEFHVATLTKGASMLYPVTFGGVDYGLSLYANTVPLLPAFTVHYYARAKTGNLLIWQSYSGTAKVFIDGVAQASHYVLTPAEGWRSVRIEVIGDPYNGTGYAPEWMRLYQAANNDSALFACLGLSPGVGPIDDNLGLLPASNLWSV